MDYFAIISFDIANSSDARVRHREAHRQRIQQLQEEDRLLTAGPLPRTDVYGEVSEGFQGSLIIAAFEDLETARQWANLDPYNAEGIYMETTVYPYQKTF